MVMKNCYRSHLEVEPGLIVAEDSPFSFSGRMQRLERFAAKPATPGSIDSEEHEPSIRILYQSLDSSGILSPLLVAEAGAGGYLLVDGLKRLQWAQGKGLELVPVHLFQGKNLVMDVIFYLAHEHSIALLDSPALRALFIRFAIDCGLDRQQAVNHLLPLLSLSSHASVLEKHLKIAALPDPLLWFCVEKGISFRRCLNLASFDRHLLDWLMARRDQLHLTASIMEEIISAMNELMKRDDLSIEELVSKGGIEVLFQQDGAASRPVSSAERTSMLRQVLRELRYPVLSSITMELSALRQKACAGVPGVEISWDNTLEHEHLDIRFRVQEISDLRRFLDQLGQQDRISAVSAMLERLKA